MLQGLLYLGPEQRLRRLLSSFYVQNLYRASPATFRTESEKGTESQNYFRMQIEQFEPI
jgi:hypothetical protein